MGGRSHYDKFLVAFHDIAVANDKGEIAATHDGLSLVDNVQAGRKELVTFPDVPARGLGPRQLSDQAGAGRHRAGGATEADRDLMVAGGYAIYVAGSATKRAPSGQTITKTFHWGFTIATQYSDCAASRRERQAIAGDRRHRRAAPTPAS